MNTNRIKFALVDVRDYKVSFLLLFTVLFIDDAGKIVKSDPARFQMGAGLSMVCICFCCRSWRGDYETGA